MITYSIFKRSNPMDPDAGEKVYAAAQRYKTWDLEELASHISSHNCKYNRADVHAVLTSLVDCIREQLLNGISIQLGEMGTFYIVLRSKGVSVEEESEYSASNITAVRVGWRRGSIFQDLLDDAQFMQVASRSLQQEAKEKMNELVFGTSSSSSSEESSDGGSSSDDSGSADQGSSDSGNQEESSGG